MMEYPILYIHIRIVLLKIPDNIKVTTTTGPYESCASIPHIKQHAVKGYIQQWKHNVNLHHHSQLIVQQRYFLIIVLTGLVYFIIPMS